MKISLTKITDSRYEFLCVREDGSKEIRTLEVKTFLVHDFLHLVVESQAGLHKSFWGLLGSGMTFDQLGGNEDMKMADASHFSEVATTEMVVGAFTSLYSGIATVEQMISGIKNMCEAQSRPYPEWLTAEFAQKVLSRMRMLVGEWNTLPRGATMHLSFPDHYDNA
jgi:hypothetical protein